MLKESVRDALDFGNLYQVYRESSDKSRCFWHGFYRRVNLLLISIIARAIAHKGSIFRYHRIVNSLALILVKSNQKLIILLILVAEIT